MVVPCLDLIMITFSREINSEVLFLHEKRTEIPERVPLGHPIILVKSTKFNMAAVSVKRSI